MKRTHEELSRSGKQTVNGLEIGGRWSDEAR